jgi:hypothetical protein
MPRYIGYNFTGTANSTVVTSALNGGVTDRKYNSGVWAINGTDESSVYGKRRSGNWLTTIRWDGYTVLACNLTASAEDLSGYTPAHTVTVSGDTTFGASGADFDGTGDPLCRQWGRSFQHRCQSGFRDPIRNGSGRRRRRGAFRYRN